MSPLISPPDSELESELGACEINIKRVRNSEKRDHTTLNPRPLNRKP